MDFKSNRVTLFREQYEAINKLPVAIQGKVYKAVIDYNFTGIIPKLTGAAQLAFDLLKAGIDVSLAKQKAGQVGGRQSGSRGEAEAKQGESKTEAEAKQSESRGEAEVKHEQSKTEAEAKQNGSSIEKSSVDSIESIESTEREERNKVSKYESTDKSAGARVQSYEEIIEDLCVAEEVRPMLWEFIKHCQANGHTLINSKLISIILALDQVYGNSERMKIFSLKKAIDGGYYDVIENKQQCNAAMQSVSAKGGN